MQAAAMNHRTVDSGQQWKNLLSPIQSQGTRSQGQVLQRIPPTLVKPSPVIEPLLSLLADLQVVLEEQDKLEIIPPDCDCYKTK